MDTPNSKRNNDPVVGWDLFGYPFNKKYPPDPAKNGRQYYGYPTYNQEVFFLDFAVENYSVRFSFQGKRYLIQPCEDGPIQLDPDNFDILGEFSDNNALIEQMDIDGHKLIEVIDALDDCEVC